MTANTPAAHAHATKALPATFKTLSPKPSKQTQHTHLHHTDGCCRHHSPTAAAAAAINCKLILKAPKAYGGVPWEPASTAAAAVARTTAAAAVARTAAVVRTAAAAAGVCVNLFDDQTHKLARSPPLGQLPPAGRRTGATQGSTQDTGETKSKVEPGKVTAADKQGWFMSGGLCMCNSACWFTPDSHETPSAAVVWGSA
jgi:hypothetical protein